MQSKLLIDGMPQLKPVPIATNGLPLLLRIWALLTTVRKWEVVKDWRMMLPNGVIIVIPKGFIFDGASVPKPLWFLLSPVGLLLVAGLVHDFAYRYGYLWQAGAEAQTYTKYVHGGGKHYDWDELFLGINLEVNGMIITDHIASLLLAMFGSIAWEKNRNLKSPEISPYA